VADALPIFYRKFLVYAAVGISVIICNSILENLVFKCVRTRCRQEGALLVSYKLLGQG